MAWTYEQSTGRLFNSDGKLINIGYSGGGCDPLNVDHVKGKNNPSMESIHNIGPLPSGGYTMESPVNSHTHGPYAIPLIPDITNEMFGRDAFMCHGDSIVHPGFASDGCIIQSPQAIRVSMWESGDRRINVMATVTTDERGYLI